MALKAMADNGVNITCQEDARLYDYLAGQDMDYVMRGIGDAFKITQSSTTLLVKLGSGECVIQGRHITNTNSTDVTLTLPQNSNGYLVLRYDLSQSSGNEVSFTYASVLEDDDLNNAGVKRDIALGKYITNEAGVSSFTDLRKYSTKLTKLGFVTSKKLTFTTSGATTMTVSFSGDYTSDDYTASLNYPTNLSLEQIQAIGECVPWLTSSALSGSNTNVTVALKGGKAPSVNFDIEVVIKYEGVSR